MGCVNKIKWRIYGKGGWPKAQPPPCLHHPPPHTPLFSERLNIYFRVFSPSLYDLLYLLCFLIEQSGKLVLGLPKRNLSMTWTSTVFIRVYVHVSECACVCVGGVGQKEIHIRKVAY